jgi:hypothetical protein
MIAGHEIAIYIIKYFIGVDVAVIVGGGNGLGMVIVHPRGKSADNEVVGLKGLMHGGRLMDPSGYRFEVQRRKDIRITVAIPSYDVKRMRTVGDVMEDPFFLDFYQEFPSGVDGSDVGGQSKISLTKG